MIIGFAFHIMAMTAYKSILVSKANTNTAECIKGKFYYIKEEGDNL